MKLKGKGTRGRESTNLPSRFGSREFQLPSCSPLKREALLKGELRDQNKTVWQRGNLGAMGGGLLLR